MSGTDISRRDVVVAGAAVLPAALAADRALGAESGAKPNIIFFLADDLGVADISCYGAPQIRTPAIDGLAVAGARFTQAYANSAVCTASRTALITGRYQYRLPIGLEEPLGLNPVGMPPEHPTLPSLLKKAGYATSLLGKWHLGDLPNFGPLKSGYDHFYGFRGGGVDYFSHQSGGKADLWDDDTPVVEPGYLTALLGQRAVQMVAAHAKDSRPFFMSVHFNAPHWPWEGPDDEAESKRIGGAIGDADGGKLVTYNRMVEAMDRQIGLVLKALDRTGQAGNTIVIFTSDNGGERFSNTWPFTGKKTELLEGGLRVPTVVRWPKRIRRGVVSSQTTMTMDWLPTLLAAAGSRPDPAYPADGMNLLPTMVAKAPAVPRTLYWKFKANAQRAIRDGDYKALKIGKNTFLFNVVDDPLERSNLKRRYPDIYKRLTEAWVAWNMTMLQSDAKSATNANSGADWADHINTPAIDRAAIDDGAPWPP